MIETKTYQSAISLRMRGLSTDRLELSRLMAAAVINPQFCRLLLENPEQALDAGFQDETFSFTDEERDLIMSIRADSLAGLASQLERTFNEHVSIPVNRPAQLTGYLVY